MFCFVTLSHTDGAIMNFRRELVRCLCSYGPLAQKLELPVKLARFSLILKFIGVFNL